MNKQRLLFVVNVDWFFKSHRLSIAIEAIRQGYEVHLACLNTGDFDEFSKLGIHCHDVAFSRSGANPIKEWRAIKQLADVIKHVNADIVHTVTIKPALYVGLLAKVITIPALVVAISGLGLMFSSKGHGVKRALIKTLYRLALFHNNKKIIFQNPSDRDTLLTVLGAPATVAEMIKGSGVDLREFDYSPEPSPVAGVASEQTIQVVMAARLLKDKGVYDFVAAAQRINDDPSVDARFLLVGGPDSHNPTSVTPQEFAQWQKADYIEAIGPSSDVASHFADSHIVVLPSYYGEGLPKVLIEAAAIGRAVVTTNNAGCLEAVIPNETALIIEPRNVNQLVEALTRLITDQALRQSMGSKGRQLAEAEFDVNAVAQRHIQIYQGLSPQQQSKPQ